MIFLIILLGFAAYAVDAQTLPDRYSVSGVAADDVLNIRELPSGSSEKVGELGPYLFNVEVLRTMDGWGHIGADERSGWVSMNFLVPNPVPAGELLRPMSCFGTEPFWDISFYPRGAEYNFIGEGRRPLTILRESVASNGYIVEAQEDPTLTRTLIINALPCSDGMSDRQFGMSMAMFTDTPDGNSVRTGCCTMQLN